MQAYTYVLYTIFQCSHTALCSVCATNEDLQCYVSGTGMVGRICPQCARNVTDRVKVPVGYQPCDHEYVLAVKRADDVLDSIVSLGVRISYHLAVGDVFRISYPLVPRLRPSGSSYPNTTPSDRETEVQSLFLHWDATNEPMVQRCIREHGVSNYCETGFLRDYQHPDPAGPRTMR